jgi:hypothetical protein
MGNKIKFENNRNYYWIAKIKIYIIFFCFFCVVKTFLVKWQCGWLLCNVEPFRCNLRIELQGCLVFEVKSRLSKWVRSVTGVQCPTIQLTGQIAEQRSFRKAEVLFSCKYFSCLTACVQFARQNFHNKEILVPQITLNNIEATNTYIYALKKLFDVSVFLA